MHLRVFDHFYLTEVVTVKVRARNYFVGMLLWVQSVIAVEILSHR